MMSRSCTHVRMPGGYDMISTLITLRVDQCSRSSGIGGFGRLGAPAPDSLSSLPATTGDFDATEPELPHRAAQELRAGSARVEIPPGSFPAGLPSTHRPNGNGLERLNRRRAPNLSLSSSRECV